MGDNWKVAAVWFYQAGIIYSRLLRHKYIYISVVSNATKFRICLYMYTKWKEPLDPAGGFFFIYIDD